MNSMLVFMFFDAFYQLAAFPEYPLIYAFVFVMFCIAVII